MAYGARIGTKSRIAGIATIAMLGMAGCGGDNDETAAQTTDPSGPGSLQGGVSYYISAGKFTKAALPDQAQIAKDFVIANPVECQNAHLHRIEPLLELVSSQAAAAPPDTPLTGILLNGCSKL
jgi:hypothetical protein